MANNINNNKPNKIISAKTKKEAEELQEIHSKLFNLPLKGVPGKQAHISDIPGPGWTISIFPIIENEKTGEYEVEVVGEIDELIKDNKDISAEEKDKLNNALLTSVDKKEEKKKK